MAWVMGVRYRWFRVMSQVVGAGCSWFSINSERMEFHITGQEYVQWPISVLVVMIH